MNTAIYSLGENHTKIACIAINSRVVFHFLMAPFIVSVRNVDENTRDRE